MATEVGSLKREGATIQGSCSLADLTFGVVPRYGPIGTENDIALVRKRNGEPTVAMGVRVTADGTLSVRLINDVTATGRRVFRSMKVYASSDNLMEFDAIQKAGTTADFYTTEGSMVILS